MAVRRVRVKVGERWYTVEVEEPISSPARVTVEGETYLVEVEGLPSSRTPLGVPSPSLPPPMPSSNPATVTAPSEGVISSPMPGKVLSINVKPGGRVSMGDEVCVIEAMKMEQSILAPRDGMVKQVHVKPLQQVTINEPLMELG